MKYQRFVAGPSLKIIHSLRYENRRICANNIGTEISQLHQETAPND